MTLVEDKKTLEFPDSENTVKLSLISTNFDSLFVSPSLFGYGVGITPHDPSSLIYNWSSVYAFVGSPSRALFLVTSTHRRRFEHLNLWSVPDPSLGKRL